MCFGRPTTMRRSTRRSTTSRPRGVSPPFRFSRHPSPSELAKLLGELHDAYAESRVDVNKRGVVLDRTHALEVEDDGWPAKLLRAADFVDADGDERRGHRVIRQLEPAAQSGEGCMGILDRSNGREDGVDTASPEFGQQAGQRPRGDPRRSRIKDNRLGVEFCVQRLLARRSLAVAFASSRPASLTTTP